MGLPRAIQDQIDAADALVEQMNGETPPNGEAPPEYNQPAEQPLAPQPQEPVQTAPPEQVPEETWERKFITLQGKYDAEVPRMNAQLREMNEAIRQLVAENTSLKATPPTPAPAPTPTVPLITDSDREAFGSDLIDLADRIAKQNLAAYEASATAQADRIKKLEAQLGSVNDRVVVSDKDRFYAGLTSAVTDWEAINTNQSFLGWLAEVDPIYGMPRQAGLQQAFDNLDVGRVAAIFNKFKELAGVKPPPAPTGTQELQRQVAPNRSRTGSVPNDTSNTQKVWTEAEIARVYDQSIKGYIDPTESAVLMKEIDAAVSEGRVR